MVNQAHRSLTRVSVGDSTPCLVSLRCGSVEQGVEARCLQRFIGDYPSLNLGAVSVYPSYSFPHLKAHFIPTAPPPCSFSFLYPRIDENWSGNGSECTLKLTEGARTGWPVLANI